MNRVTQHQNISNPTPNATERHGKTATDEYQEARFHNTTLVTDHHLVNNMVAIRPIPESKDQTFSQQEMGYRQIYSLYKPNNE
jgi:hypothetical protein